MGLTVAAGACLGRILTAGLGFGGAGAEMIRAGAVELLMPSIQPAELWQQSGRWAQMGAEMLRLKDRHGNDFCYGPTHEEVIVHHVKQRDIPTDGPVHITLSVQKDVPSLRCRRFVD